MAVKTYSLTAKLMASIGYQDFVVHGDANWSYYLFDFYASQSVVNTNPQTPQDATLYALGVRLAIRALQVSGSASFSLGGVAASATLDNTSTSLQLDLVGLPKTQALSYALEVGEMNEFDINAIRELGKATGQLIDFLTVPANTSNLTGVPVAVVMNDEATETAATSFGFALRGIQNGMQRFDTEDANPNELPDGVDISDAVIRSTYHLILGNDTGNQDPSAAEKQVAWNLTHTGP